MNDNQNKGGANAPEPQVPNLDSVVNAQEITDPSVNLGGNQDSNPPANNTNTNTDTNVDVVDPNDLENAITDRSQDDNNEALQISETTQSVLDKLYGEDENDTTLREETLSAFNGKSFDENGNIVNEEGKVVLNSEDLAKYLETGEYTTDEDGNHVNELGEVLRTAEEIQKANSIVLSTRDAIQDKLGIEFTDDQGNPIEYEDTEEGIAKMVEDAIIKKTGDSVRGFLNNNPELKDVYQHLALGGKMEDYTSNSINYKQIDINTLNESQQLKYIEKSFKEQGLQDPGTLVDLIKTAGGDKVKQEAAKALLTLDNIQTQKNQYREQQLAQQAQQEEQETIQYWEDVKQTVQKGKLKDITIPANERDAFFDFIARPADNQGRSKDQILEDSEGEEAKLLASYLRYKGGDLSKLASIISKQERVKTLRERSNRGVEKVTSAQTRNTNQSSKTAFIPSLSNLGI